MLLTKALHTDYLTNLKQVDFKTVTGMLHRVTGFASNIRLSPLVASSIVDRTLTNKLVSHILRSLLLYALS